MKKLLTFLASSSMLTQASVGVVSCIPKTENPPQKEQLTEEKLKDYVSNLTLNYSGKTVIPDGTIISSELMGNFLPQIRNPLSKIATKLFFDGLNEKYDYEGYGFALYCQRPDENMTIAFEETHTFKINMIYSTPTQNNSDYNPTLSLQLKIKFEGQSEGLDYIQQMIDSYLLFYRNENYFGGVNVMEESTIAPLSDTEYHSSYPLQDMVITEESNLLIDEASNRYQEKLNQLGFKNLKINVQTIKIEPNVLSEHQDYADVKMTISLVDSPSINKTTSFRDIISYAN